MATTPGPSLEPSVVVAPPLFASDDDDQSKLPTLEASVDANDTADEEDDEDVTAGVAEVGTDLLLQYQAQLGR